ncbi:class Ib ribonucleoside-diphosphate reductase assembly flavoprotein NrdI [Corynebacterium cystitidis]|uniref:Protein NrdI n=1 Tax=Corynebacterium cystitidis DSM 20524 TaxID=1121357 RepID=A0A1H9SHH9_9CORY|nr:class Ib ribonucleoside-diphosphate reductase assembly flavoprotein NrdI [Corynebacterium cystitidis]WJY83041.1 Putative NrdI-like protein [Corynebacterium cystitidis DSM 20524]SER84348.1 protein involved in ribonucleotide reduction [Corynebacterium cystitidis DSM 20524]SNV65196.1 ribonucleotide reductase stimulatory protein [Corynebacterium cystitidis]
MLVVYFSSVTENTRRFVDKLGLPSKRIPLYRKDEPLVVDEPYVLICPTYGGGVSLSQQNTRPVPKQVIRFLNNEHNRSLIRGVIAAGNSNFGPDYCISGDVISHKCQVPYLYRFELMGMPEDVVRVRDELINNAERLGLNPIDSATVDAIRAEQEEKTKQNAEILARLRARYDHRVRS